MAKMTRIERSMMRRCAFGEESGVPTITEFHARHRRVFWLLVAIAAVIIALLLSRPTAGMY